MQLEMIISSEVSQKDKDKCHRISLIRGIQNMTQMDIPMKQKQTHSHREYLKIETIMSNTIFPRINVIS